MVALLVLAACSQTPAGTQTGLVVDVTGTLDDVESFTVLIEGEEVALVPANDGDYAFALGHLRDHLRSGEPVAVRWEEREGDLVATFIDDG